MWGLKPFAHFFSRVLEAIRGELRRFREAPREEYREVTNASRQVVVAHSVKVADQGASRRKGLLGHKGLRLGEGLWIVPCESVHTIGMKFPIDLIYLDRDLKVKKVVHEVPRWRLSACFSAHSVLELAAGSVRPTQTKRGDQLRFQPVSPANDKIESRTR